MLEIRERVVKKCFYTRKDGTTGVMFHKSVVLTDGTTIRYSKDSWKIVSPEQFSTAVATSLTRYAMATAVVNGKMRSEVKERHSFKNFMTEMVKMVSVETFMEIVSYLGGKK